MIEMHILATAKETDNKLRWDAFIDGVRFALYIPKWRVPTPWPSTILVTISDKLARYQTYEPLLEDSVQDEPNLRQRPILALVEYISGHTETLRFAPAGDPRSWEIGEPYIPIGLLGNQSSGKLLIEVKWA